MKNTPTNPADQLTSAGTNQKEVKMKLKNIFVNIARVINDVPEVSQINTYGFTAFLHLLVQAKKRGWFTQGKITVRNVNTNGFEQFDSLEEINEAVLHRLGYGHDENKDDEYIYQFGNYGSEELL